MDDESRTLTWEKKGLRLRRGIDRKFLKNYFVDDIARSQYVDDEAQSTDRSDSRDSDSESSDSDSSD